MVLDCVRLEMKDGAEQVEILRLARPRLDELLPGGRSIPNEHHGGGMKKTIVLAGLRMAGEMNPRTGLQKVDELVIIIGQLQPQDETPPHERVRQHAFLVRGNDDQRRLARDLDRSSRSQRSELARAEGLQQSVGDVGVRLVDFVDQYDAAVR